MKCATRGALQDVRVQLDNTDTSTIRKSSLIESYLGTRDLQTLSCSMEKQDEEKFRDSFEIVLSLTMVGDCSEGRLPVMRVCAMFVKSHWL